MYLLLKRNLQNWKINTGKGYSQIQLLRIFVGNCSNVSKKGTIIFSLDELVNSARLNQELAAVY